MLVSVSTHVKRGPKFGEGGEGTVFEVAGHEHLLLKIYRVEPGAEKRAILQRIIGAASDLGVDRVAWPQGLVDAQGQTGVLLPRVADARPIHQLFDIVDARKFFGPLDWRQFITAARDVAQACAEVHAAGFVVVDISDSNVLVRQSLRATLIDCDSFVPQNAGVDSITSIGTPLWLAPELAGLADTTPRTPDHDNFALAQLIFLLLFQGSPPLATPPGEDPASGGEKVFAFSRRNPMRRPGINELTLDEVTYHVAEMFEAAFRSPGTVARPTAEAWVAALERMEQELVTCQQVSTHSHLLHRRCPWCSMARVDADSDPFPAPRPTAPPADASSPTAAPTAVPEPMVLSPAIFLSRAEWFFISHAAEDGDFAENIKFRMAQKGMNAWIDVDVIEAGVDWRNEIDDAIREATAMILVLSPDSKSSEYVTYEWAFGLGAGTCIVPILLRSTPIHPRLMPFQYLDFTNRRARPWERFFRRLEDIHATRGE